MNYLLFILEGNLNLFYVNKVLLLNITLVVIFFLKKEAANISPWEERQNLNITKYELIKKSVEIFWTYSLGVKNILVSIAVGRRNFEQQTKTQIFYFQELWRYVVLFLLGEEYI